MLWEGGRRGNALPWVFSCGEQRFGTPAAALRMSGRDKLGP